jgi:glycine/D-amino acid oxidase-like deaminating enzyme
VIGTYDVAVVGGGVAGVAAALAAARNGAKVCLLEKESALRNHAWDISRAISTCAVTGEAAGTATALASQRTEGCFSKLDVKLIQDQLKAQEVIIDKDLALER